MSERIAKLQANQIDSAKTVVDEGPVWSGIRRTIFKYAQVTGLPFEDVVEAWDSRMDAILLQVAP